MREGNWLVGYGMAGVTFGGAQLPTQVRISIRRDGSAHVRSAATDIGTGTYTIATQLAAELLGLDLGRVRVEIGDSDLPSAAPSGGSGLAAARGGRARRPAPPPPPLPPPPAPPAEGGPAPPTGGAGGPPFP